MPRKRWLALALCVGFVLLIGVTLVRVELGQRAALDAAFTAMPRLPDAQVTSVERSDRQAIGHYATRSTPEEVIAFYDQQLAQQRWMTRGPLQTLADALRKCYADPGGRLLKLTAPKTPSVSGYAYELVLSRDICLGVRN